ncbi:MAG: ParA family protein, partial [Beijerinckiaceae bacterium]
GGVGKTTTVVSLAEALAADDLSASVLVVDLDPGASASVCLAGENLLAEMITGDRTVEAFLEDRLRYHEKTKLAPKIRNAVCATTHAGYQLKISLLPCGPHLRVVEREIIYHLTERHFDMKGIEGQTWELFEQEFVPLGKTYDYVIFDCPPGISPLSEAAIRASDLIIVPTIPDSISVFGLKAFIDIFWKAPHGSLPRPKRLPHVLVTRFLRTVKQHREVVEGLEEAAKQKVPVIRLLRTKVQQAAALAAALGKGDEVLTFSRRYGEVTYVLDQLVQELRGILHGN